MLLMEFDPILVNLVENSHKSSPTLPVAVQLHDQTYVRRAGLGTLEATWGQDGLLGPVKVCLIPQEAWPASRTSCRILSAEASETAEATGGVPAETPGATFWLASLEVVKEILNRFTNYEKVKKILGTWLQADW